MTDHETLLSVGPVTVAVNVGVEQVRTFAGLGETVMVTGPGAGESTGASAPASKVGLGAGVALDESSHPKTAAEAPAASRSALAHPMTLRMIKVLFPLVTAFPTAASDDRSLSPAHFVR
jgi:hypothetical protein